MPRLPRSLVERATRATVRPVARLPLSTARRLILAARHLNRVPRGVRITQAGAGGVHGELVSPRDAGGVPRLLYVHGGAYRLAAPATHRNVVSALALRLDTCVFSVEYRLAPEHPAPAALDDVVAAYRALAGRGGESIALAGDSAGAGLALACAIAVRDAGDVPPAGLALISPWVDLTLSGESNATNDGRDALLSNSLLVAGAAEYASVLDPADPRCSPLFADLAGLPPMLIQAGGIEVLRSDAERLSERATAAGTEVELEIADDLWHGYHVHAGMLREADDAVATMGDWLARRLGA